MSWSMVALVLALSLAAAQSSGPEPKPAVSLAPPPRAALRLEPPANPGPFGAAELAGAAAGTALADLAIAGAGWATLQLFATDTLSPNARNFRRAAYVLGASALIVPPLAAVLFGNWAGPGRGGFWRAWLVGFLGQAAAITAGILAAPHVWVALPTQLVTVSLATSLGLYWGRGGARDDRDTALEPDPAPPAAAPVARAPAGTCPIG